MIHYLIYSTLSMGALLLFYHLVLSKEKIYQINRYYLLFSLVFSLTVPLIPIGMTSSWLGFGDKTDIITIASNNIEEASENPAANSLKNNSAVQPSANARVYSIIFWLYAVITLFFLMRLAWHLHQMRLRTLKNPAILFKGHKVILLDDDISPHNFGKTIFVNKNQYETGVIPEDILLHEFIHARQNHSLDILFVEILKALSWFNPLIYLYKTAIQLNHEYIADEKVLSNGTDIVDYQALLLKMRTNKPVHYLSTRFNFKSTKKRFQMMTLKNITYHSYLKIALIIPVSLILGITFGCNPTQSHRDQQNLTDQQNKTINLEIVNPTTIRLDGKTMPLSNFKTASLNLFKDHPKATVSIKIPKTIPNDQRSELLTKIQKTLQNQGALRINYSAMALKNKQADHSRHVTLKRKNILKLYIGKKGDIFVNKKQVSLSSVKRLVEDFITNNGKADNLSESPQKAIIAIKTDKKTSYEIYSHTIDEVVEAYNELRNQASEKMFGKSFQALKEGSKQMEEIKAMYPKQISIAQPVHS